MVEQCHAQTVWTLRFLLAIFVEQQSSCVASAHTRRVLSSASGRPQRKTDPLAEAHETTCWRDVVPDSSSGPFEEILHLFDKVDLIVGYNALDFDFPLLRKYYNRNGGHTRYIAHRAKCHDIFTRVREVTGRWLKLDFLLLNNGIAGKSGTGKSAVDMFYNGQREELAEYCMTDVRRTAELALLPSLYWGQASPLPAPVFAVSAALAAVSAPVSKHRTHVSKKRVRE